MGRFRFHLEAVLTQRRAAERAHQVTVSHIEREKIDLERTMLQWNEQLVMERTDLRERLDGGGTGGLRLARFQANAALTLVARLRQASVRLAGVYSRLETERKTLAAMAGGRQAVEKLRALHFEEWKSQRERREWSDQDDLASCGFSPEGPPQSEPA